MGSRVLSLFIIIIIASIITSKSSFAHVSAVEMRPAMLQSKVLPLSETRRRRLGSFQLCALCTCCGGPKGLCLPSPCCYAINCNIPNRPFGFCSFTPKSCNCLGCHL